MIRAENIFKRFGTQEVLKGISTTFEAGKTNLVIGRSGSGKTVMLKVLVGLFKPEQGRVLYGDTNSSRQIRKLYVNYIWKWVCSSKEMLYLTP